MQAQQPDFWKPALYTKQHAFVHEYGEDLVQLLAPQKDEHILDVGCGTGELTHQISTFCASVSGIDSSIEMINAARKAYPEINFEHKDTRYLDSVDEYDAIFSNAVLHWIKEADLVISALSKSLKPGGRLVVEMGGKGNVARIVNTLQATLAESGFEEQSKRNPWYFPSIAEYASILEKHELTVTHAWHFDRPTELDGKAGLTHWLSQFSLPFFKNMSEKEILDIIELTADKLKAELYVNDKWYADYKRLRFICRK